MMPTDRGAREAVPGEAAPDEAAPDGIDHRVELDVMGALAGTDKCSSFTFAWDYLKHFEEYFAPFRDLPITVMEVGVKGGASLRLWKRYFGAATIVGIDIDPACAAMTQDRIAIEIGSQADPQFLRAVCARHRPTIFIDDGSHLAQHNILTFEHVFPMLLPGGVYVVEDLAFHFDDRDNRWQTPQRRNAPEYFLDLARSRLARRAVPGAEAVPADLPAMVDGVTFVGSAAIIRRAYLARDLDRAAALGRRHLTDVDHGQGAEPGKRLAAYLDKHRAGMA